MRETPVCRILGPLALSFLLILQASPTVGLDLYQAGRMAVPGSAPGFACGVAVADTLAYVAAGPRIWIVSVADSSMPFLVGSVSARDSAQDIAVADGFAYVADSDSGLTVVDVGDPASPAVLGWLDTPGVAGGVATDSAGHAYLADGQSGFRVIDVTDPYHPAEVGSLAMTSTTHPCLRGSEAILAEICGFPPHLRIVDTSDPAAPAVLGSYHLTMCSECCICAQGLAVSGNYAYVSIYESYFWVHGGQWIYSHRLGVVDITDPLAPREANRISTGEPGPVDVENGLALLCMANSRVNAIDVRLPGNLAIMGGVQVPGKLRDIQIAGDLAYVAAGSAGLVILKIGPLGLLVAGRVTKQDGSGLSGVTLRLSGDAAETVAAEMSGRYRFDELEPGAYTVTPSRTGYVFTPPARVYENLTGNDLAADFVGTRVYTIAGTVANGWGDPIAGVRVEITGATIGEDTTGADGVYRFEGLARGSYEITPRKHGWRFSPMSRVCGDLAADSLRQDFSGRWIGFGARKQVTASGDTGRVWVEPPPAGHVRISRTGQGAVRIEAVADREGTLEITVFSVTGQVLWRTDLSVQASRPSTAEWCCDDRTGCQVAPGIYFLRAEGAGLSCTRKIAITR